jgi:glycosyltransferase involved in cell wall biosynthesis
MPNPQDRPAVSVVMAVHNGMPYVEEAVRSMMNQTLREIEIIIIDDASTDETPQVLARLAGEDPRIRTLTNETNLKLAASLNRGLDVARAPLIARMDADDISMPHRLEVQKRYMDAHPDIILSGTSIRRIDTCGNRKNTLIREYDDFIVRWLMRFTVPLAHPTFIFRRKSPCGRQLRYDPQIKYAQDYDFIFRAQDYGKVTSVSEVLLDWRVHRSSASSARLQEQNHYALQIAHRVHARDLPPELHMDASRLVTLFRGDDPIAVHDVRRSIQTYRMMITHDVRTSPERYGDLLCHAVRGLVFNLQGRGFSKKALAGLLVVMAPEYALAGAKGFIRARLRKVV